MKFSDVTAYLVATASLAMLVFLLNVVWKRLEKVWDEFGKKVKDLDAAVQELKKDNALLREQWREQWKVNERLSLLEGQLQATASMTQGVTTLVQEQTGETLRSLQLARRKEEGD